MSVLVYGFNHKTAPLELREQVAFTKARLPYALQRARADLALSEVVILSTCNRTELYCSLDDSRHTDAQGQQLGNWIADFHNLDQRRLLSVCYQHHDEQAARHAIRVASGLDSMVLGEPQIMGQVKTAYSTALQSETAGPVLNQLNQHSLAAAKRIRAKTKIGHNPVTLAYATLTLASKIFADIADCTALLIGVGEIIELMARHLLSADIKRLIIANRTLEHAKNLARPFGADAISLGDLRENLSKADIIVSCTGSEVALVGKGMVEEALHRRQHKPIFMADLAVPRDIEPEAGELANIYLYKVDDLERLITKSNRNRLQAARAAEPMVHDAAADFMSYLKGRDAISVIADLRQQAERLAAEELAKAEVRLAKGEDAREVVQHLSRALVNKWLHNPVTALRRAASEEQKDVLHAAMRLHRLGNNKDTK